MARKPKDKDQWTVRCIGVFFDENNQRYERPLEEISPEELQEIAHRKNREAMRAAGYIPVEEANAKCSI